jgi:hypothetical protein
VLAALRYPFSFAVLVVAYVVGLSVRGLAQRVISGQRQPAWVRANARRRTAIWLKPFVDPYGCVAAALGGIGWGSPVDISDTRTRTRGRRIAQLLAGPISLAVLGIAALLAFKAWSHIVVGGQVVYVVLYGQAFISGNGHPHAHYGLPFGQVALLLAGVEWVAMAALAILPLPPLDGGKLLFTLAPQRSNGWQRARYRLDEENWGLLILLVLAVPFLFRRVLLVSLVGAMVDPLIRLVS